MNTSNPKLTPTTNDVLASKGNGSIPLPPGVTLGPPVTVLPNLKLMAMETAVSNSSRDLRFRISGMVTEYNGKNFVLLDKAVVVPDVDQQF